MAKYFGQSNITNLQSPLEQLVPLLRADRDVPGAQVLAEPLNRRTTEISSPSPPPKEERAGVRRHSGLMGNLHSMFDVPMLVLQPSRKF
jgi:hypothetical protein